MLFRDRSTSRGHSQAETTSLLARLVGCALPGSPRRSRQRIATLAFQTLEPRMVMSGSLDLCGGIPVDEESEHAAGCGCGCCCEGGHLHGLDPIESTEPVDGETGGGETFPMASIPVLSSNPGAEVKLYLDFNGHYEAQWGAYSNITTPAFSIDGDYNSFSTAEIDAITEIWQRVSEDYAPFNIDVTTVEPGSFANGDALRVVIGGNSSWYGGTVGGLGYINSFTDSVVNTVYVFPDHLAKNAKYIAEASSHEAGHGFGLRHQSKYVNGVKTDEYHPGSGDWGAIMGVSYSRARSTWHNGNSYSASAYQDDMAVISRAANGFGYRTDDHGGLNSATALNFTGVTASASGIVEQMTDTDGFSFSTAAGQLTLELDVAAVGANLDAVLELWTQSGELIATADPSNSYGAVISMTVDAGNYVAIVRSTGQYGSVGQYTLSAARAETATEIAISGDSTVAEDHVYTLDLDQVVVGSSPIQSWTINWGDGTVQVLSGNPGSATHIYSSGPGEFTIHATATDGEDTFEANDIVVEVFDPVPDLGLSGPTYVTEGNTYHLSLSAAGTGAASITKWTINWGDGTIQVISGDPDSAEHVYADGTTVYTIQATATNAFGTYSANSKNVTVHNAAADVHISGESSIDGGTTYVLNLSATDPGDDTITHWTINWGDGTIQNISGNPSSVSHVYDNSGGEFTISATATDEDGTYASNTLAVNVTEMVIPPLNFDYLSVDSFGNQDVDGNYWIENGGKTLRLYGNTWKSISLPYTVTVNTVLEFEFSSSSKGEIHAIGFDTDDNASPSRSFFLYGKTPWGLDDFADYAGEAPGTVHYRIPVGQYFTGNMLKLVFINDDDVASSNAVSLFSNVKVYEGLTARNDSFTVEEGDESIELDVLGNDSPTEGVNEDELQIVAVGEGSRGGTMVISNDGRSLIYTPAAGHAGVETFTYTLSDGSGGGNVTAVVSINVLAATSISGDDSATEEGSYFLGLSSRSGVTVTGWTINWGDGTVQTINGSPSSVTHQYENKGFHYEITATARNNSTNFHAHSLNVYVPGDNVSFNNFTVATYSSTQDVQGSAHVEDGGNTLRLQGNVWKRINFDYTITVDTVLELEFTSVKAAEIQAIGLDTNLHHDPSRAFQLAGTESWGLQDYRISNGESGTVKIVIPIGKFYTGNVWYLFFINDDDVAIPNSESKFSKVRVYEKMAAHDDWFEVDEAAGSFTLNVLANDTKTTGVSDPLQITQVGSGSAGGTIVISGDGKSLIYTPAAGFVGTETFSYTMTDGMPGSESSGTVRVVVDAATAVSGDAETTAGEPYVLRLSSRDGLPVTNWTIDWGDGTVRNVVGDPTYVTHTYQNSGRRHTITAQARNGGTDYAAVSLDVDVSIPNVDFNERPIRTYAGRQDAGGVASTVSDGTALRLKGNTWKRVSMPFTITPETVLEFDLRVLREGEIHGIGFDNDWYHSSTRTFQLRGTETWGIQDFRTSVGANGTVHYRIPVGQFYLGYVKYLFFVNDHDAAGSLAAECVYSNIRVYEHGPAPAGAAESYVPPIASQQAISDPFASEPTDLIAALAEVDRSLTGKKQVTEPIAAEAGQPVAKGAAADSWSSSAPRSWAAEPWSVGRTAKNFAGLPDAEWHELFFALYDGTLD